MKVTQHFLPRIAFTRPALNQAELLFCPVLLPVCKCTQQLAPGRVAWHCNVDLVVRPNVGKLLTLLIEVECLHLCPHDLVFDVHLLITTHRHTKAVCAILWFVVVNCLWHQSTWLIMQCSYSTVIVYGCIYIWQGLQQRGIKLKLQLVSRNINVIYMHEYFRLDVVLL